MSVESVEATLTVTYPTVGFHLSIALTAYTIALGGSVTIYGSFSHEDLGPLPGFTVKLVINGVEVATTTTASNGSYSFTFKPDKAGSYKIKGRAYI